MYRRERQSGAPQLHGEGPVHDRGEARGHHLRGGQLGHLSAGRQEGQEQEEEGSHDPGAALVS